MSPATRSAHRLLAVALLLAGAAAASAEPLAFSGTPRLYQEVQPSPAGATFAFEADVTLAAAGQAYLKVVPAPGNPAFLNGSAEAGWWTTVRLSGPAVEAAGGTNGTRVAGLGDVAAGATYTLRLEVRVPPGALAAPTRHALRYALAIHETAGAGSGGQLDPSLSVTPRIVVSEQAAEAVEAPPAGPDGIPPALLAASAAAVVGLVLVARRRRGGDAHPP